MDAVLEENRTIAQQLKRPMVYDEKELWETFHSWGKAGTVNMLQRYATSKGMYSPGKSEANRMGAFIAMWRYAFKNPEEAYPHWKRWAEDYVNEMAENPIRTDFTAFKREIRDTVHRNHIFGPRKLKAWCEKWKVEYNY